MKEVKTILITLILIAVLVGCHSKNDVSYWEIGNIEFSSIKNEKILYDTISTNNNFIDFYKIIPLERTSLTYKGVEVHNPKFFIQNDTVVAVRFYIHNIENILSLNKEINKTSNPENSLVFNNQGKTEIIINQWKSRNKFKQLHCAKLTTDKSYDSYNVTSFLKNRDGYGYLTIIDSLFYQKKEKLFQVNFNGHLIPLEFNFKEQ